MTALGAAVDSSGGDIVCSAADGLHGAKINFKIPSVGATENAMLAASMASGVTILTNAAREPEIEDLQNFLNKLGAGISGAGTSTIVILGGARACAVEHRIIPDRIAASTYLAAAAATKGIITVEDVIPKHLSTVTDVLEESGCIIEKGETSIKIWGSGHLRAVSPVITSPYPGFPTDAQPPIMAASLMFRGTTAFVENIFENRYRHTQELRCLGADIKTEGKVALVRGGKKLHGAYVKATDLRGGAALVVAALAASGETRICDVFHIDRGYESIEAAFSSLGGDISRITE